MNHELLAKLLAANWELGGMSVRDPHCSRSNPFREVYGHYSESLVYKIRQCGVTVEDFICRVEGHPDYGCRLFKIDTIIDVVPEHAR